MSDKRQVQQMWAHYKYEVLSHSQAHYHRIREELKEDSVELVEIEKLIQEALAQEEQPGQMTNALDHIWGYFKKHAEPSEKDRYLTLLADYRQGERKSSEVLSYLKVLLDKYPNAYLEQSSIFQNVD